MNQAEITKLVKVALEKDPTLFIREYLQQQIYNYVEHIKYDQANIRRLHKELAELDSDDN